jgi:hypothetical protein
VYNDDNKGDNNIIYLEYAKLINFLFILIALCYLYNKIIHVYEYQESVNYIIYLTV